MAETIALSWLYIPASGSTLATKLVQRGSAVDTPSFDADRIDVASSEDVADGIGGDKPGNVVEPTQDRSAEDLAVKQRPDRDAGVGRDKSGN
jgi:hypothetical protein